MSYDIHAIFDHGVLHPLEPLELANGVRVHLRIEEEPEAGASELPALPDEIARRKAALADFQKLMADLPVESPKDDFSGAEHDQFLYGSP